MKTVKSVLVFAVLFIMTVAIATAIQLYSEQYFHTHPKVFPYISNILWQTAVMTPLASLAMYLFRLYRKRLSR